MIGSTLLKNKLIQRVIMLFKQGLSPQELAKSLSIGAFVGVIPLWGVTNLFLPIVAFRFRLNLPIMVLVSYLMIPLQLFFWTDFIEIGEHLIGKEHNMLSIERIQLAFQSNFFEALNELWMVVLCGLIGWVIIGAPVSFLLYLLLWRLFQFIQKEKANL